MANLSGQTIQTTYPGLLNLNTATTGITSTPQAITDGLGNNTGTKIATNWLTNPLIFGLQNIIPDNIGNGLTTTAITFATGNTNNYVYFYPFYDNGQLSFSSITNILNTVTSSSDVVNLYVYNSQYLSGNGYGIMPYQQLYSGTTLYTTGTTGTQRTTTFNSNISFSGYGPGIYYIALNITNSGVSPTVKYGTSVGTGITNIYNMLSNFLGWGQNAATAINGQPLSKNGAAVQLLTNGVKASYTSTDITTGWAIATATQLGFVLNVVK